MSKAEDLLRDADEVLGAALSAIKGREHTGFITKMRGEIAAYFDGALDADAKGTFTLKISADSGYEAETIGRCSAEQYGNAMKALHK
jgi:hypothetical protein